MFQMTGEYFHNRAAFASRKISSLLIAVKSLWLTNPARRTVLLLFIFVPIFLTFAAVLPVNVVGPFDARTYEPVNDVQVSYSSAGAAVEPVTALAQTIAGAPDIGAAAVSISIWIIAIAACVTTVRRLHRNHWRPDFHAVAAGLKTAVITLFMLTVYTVFSLLVHIPNWRLTTQDSDIVVTELHTHTLGSHDGLISAKDNLRWQAQRGCSVVGVVEHCSPRGSLYAAAVAESDPLLPAVIPAVEVGTDGFGYITAYAIRGPMAKCIALNQWDSFIPRFHQSCQGVVLSMIMPRPDQERLKRLADLGIDGFEIANQGHPGSKTIRTAALSAAQDHHLPLVAATDWHGFGGILRAWTLFRVPRARSLSRAERAAAVLDALRRHDLADITPIVIGHIGEMSTAEKAFAPFIEVLRYALGLSPLRILAWWVWDIALFLIASALLYLGIHPSRMISAVALVSMGVAILVEALRLILAYLCGWSMYVFPLKIGIETLMVGAAAVICGVGIGWYSFASRQHRMTQT
jgi:hypothetical protein